MNEEDKAYIECRYYYPLIEEFDGCPGLDVGGDDEECGDCQYRLDKVKFALEKIELL